MTTFRHALILVPAALLLTGAKPADSLRATFADPGAEYRPVPFWHLNGRLSSDEIVRQIEDAKNLAGFGGVTVLPVSPGAQHPTGKPCPGMEPAYLSREYFDRYEEMLRISERLGQKLIVYDDIDFPSGTAGGRLLREYPRYTRKLLEMQEFEVCGPARFEYPLAVSDTLRCMAVSAMETASRRIVDLGAAVRRDTLAWDVPDGVWKIMFFNCRYAVHPLVDYMEPEAVECCISMTYDQYAKRFGRYFGGVVDKVFFDDVGYVSMERTWTPAITGYRPKGIRTKNAVPRRGERHSLSVHRLPALFLKLVDLLLDSVQTQVDRLLERLAAALGQQLVSRYVDLDDSHLVALFVVLVDTQRNLSPDRTLDETVHLVHLGLNEIDQPLVGVELYGLNLHVHSFSSLSLFGPRVGLFVRLFERLDAVVRIDLRRLETRMAQQFLNHADVGPPVQQMRRERMSQHVRTALALHSGLAQHAVHDAVGLVTAHRLAVTS